MINKYRALLRAAWANMVEYRAEIIMWMMSSVLMIVMLLVWLSISSTQGDINGFARGDFIAYYMIGLLVRNLTAVWASWELDRKIREGALSPELLRPIHPIHNDIAGNWGEKSIRIFIVVPIVAVALWLTPDAHLNLQPPNVLAFVAAIFGAWLILFFSDYLIGISAFWTSQTSAFLMGWYGFRVVLSGMLAPVQLFPPAVQSLLHWLPFRYMLSFPIEVLIGKTQGADLLNGLLIQFTWAAIFIIAVRVMWRIAMKNYSAVGA
jgi:ABC-2 type transport system permease protein